MEKRLKHFYSKGAVYFSPHIKKKTDDIKGIKRKFFNTKSKSRLPAYIYLIQRL